MDRRELDSDFTFEKAKREQDKKETNQLLATIEDSLTTEQQTLAVVKLIELAENGGIIENLVKARELLGAKLSWVVRPADVPLVLDNIVAATLEKWIPKLENTSKLDVARDFSREFNVSITKLVGQGNALGHYKFPISPWPQQWYRYGAEFQPSHCSQKPISADVEEQLEELFIHWEEQQKDPLIVFELKEPKIRYPGTPDHDNWTFFVILAPKNVSFVGNEPITISLPVSSKELEKLSKEALEKIISNPLPYPIPLSPKQNKRFGQHLKPEIIDF